MQDAPSKQHEEVPASPQQTTEVPTLIADSARGARIQEDAILRLIRTSAKPYARPLALSAAPLSAVAAVNAYAVAKVGGLAYSTPCLAYPAASSSLLMSNMNYDRALATSTTERIRRLVSNSIDVTSPGPVFQSRVHFPSRF